MKIEMAFEIECTPDAAWNALHLPRVVAELYEPLMRMPGSDRLPERWFDGESGEVELRFAGLLPAGRQVIKIRDESHGEGPSLTRSIHDIGHATSGPLALLQGWHHRMTIRPSPKVPVHALWSERVEFHGPVAPLAWPLMRVIWQWRVRRIREMATNWR